MEGQTITNKHCAIYFDDKTIVTRKNGIILEVLRNCIIFKEDSTSLTQLIPYYRIVRVVQIPEGMGQNDR